MGTAAGMINYDVLSGTPARRRKPWQRFGRLRRRRCSSGGKAILTLVLGPCRSAPRRRAVFFTVLSELVDASHRVDDDEAERVNQANHLILPDLCDSGAVARGEGKCCPPALKLLDLRVCGSNARPSGPRRRALPTSSGDGRRRET